MKETLRRRRFLKESCASVFALPIALGAADKQVAVNPVEPTIVRTKELMAREPNSSLTTGHVWPLHQSATSRTNLVQMRGEGAEHIHPDAEHSLYVISGEVIVHAGDLKTTLGPGDYISIPAGLKHGYTVPKDKSALLISMDAPPYDPQKTIRSKESGN